MSYIITNTYGLAVQQSTLLENKIDVLINNAGIRHVKKLEDHNLNDWNEMISVN